MDRHFFAQKEFLPTLPLQNAGKRHVPPSSCLVSLKVFVVTCDRTDIFQKGGIDRIALPCRMKYTGSKHAIVRSTFFKGSHWSSSDPYFNPPWCSFLPLGAKLYSDDIGIEQLLQDFLTLGSVRVAPSYSSCLFLKDELL